MSPRLATQHLEHQRTRRSGLSRPLTLQLLLLLASCTLVLWPSIAQSTTTSTKDPLVIGPTYIANNSYYYSLLTARDSRIFAGSCNVVSNSDKDFSIFGHAAGMQTRYNITTASSLVDTSKLLNTQDTAYRADVLSELMVSMAIMYLEATNQLPFARTDSIASTYLPSTYTGFTRLVNPAFPTMPITLNMLLMHTSSISEVGFNLGAAQGPTGTVPTLADFVSRLFASSSSIFHPTVQPGLGASYYYSRTNTAIASYVVERVLAASTTYASLSGIGEFVFSVVLPPLGLTNTFLLNTNGRLIQATYPLTSANAVDMRPYKSVQDLTTNGTGILTSYPIHASYFSDYMLYSTTADLSKLAREVFVPGGLYYTAIGVRMLDTTVTIAAGSLLYATGRTPGLYLFGPNLLCAIFYQAVGASGTLPFCYFSDTSIPSGQSPFGLVATGGNNELALICVPLATGHTYCSVAELSFNTSATWPSANAATGGNAAVGFAMVNLARLASSPQLQEPTTSAPPSPTQLNGWFIFIGVVAALAVVVGAAFVADYFIQPAPPAKIIAPIMAGTGTGGMRAGTALTESARVHNISAGVDGGLIGEGEPVGGGDSPKEYRDTATSSSLTSSNSRPHRGQRRRRHNDNGGRDREISSDDDDDNVNDETPYILRSSSRHGGESSLRRRRRPHPQQQQQQQQQRRHSRYGNGAVSSDSGSYSTPDDGWGELDVDMAERSSTGSQRPNPQGMLRFDAYI
jgi:hypothetical protein